MFSPKREHRRNKVKKDSTYRSGRSPDWLKMKNSGAPAEARS